VKTKNIVLVKKRVTNVKREKREKLDLQVKKSQDLAKERDNR
jgi:hypothetical protein